MIARSQRGLAPSNVAEYPGTSRKSEAQRRRLPGAGERCRWSLFCRPPLRGSSGHDWRCGWLFDACVGHHLARWRWRRSRSGSRPSRPCRCGSSSPPDPARTIGYDTRRGTVARPARAGAGRLWRATSESSMPIPLRTWGRVAGGAPIVADSPSRRQGWALAAGALCRVAAAWGHRWPCSRSAAEFRCGVDVMASGARELVQLALDEVPLGGSWVELERGPVGVGCVAGAPEPLE